MRQFGPIVALQPTYRINVRWYSSTIRPSCPWLGRLIIYSVSSSGIWSHMKKERREKCRYSTVLETTLYLIKTFGSATHVCTVQYWPHYWVAILNAAYALLVINLVCMHIALIIRCDVFILLPESIHRQTLDTTNPGHDKPWTWGRLSNVHWDFVKQCSSVHNFADFRKFYLHIL
jgi:hypothetical protein